MCLLSANHNEEHSQSHYNNDKKASPRILLSFAACNYSPKFINVRAVHPLGSSTNAAFEMCSFHFAGLGFCAQNI